MLETSMQEVGYAGPMIAAADGEIIDGSARHEIAANVFGSDAEPIVVESDGKRPIIVKRTDIPNAKTHAAKRLAAYANRVGEVNLEWDANAIAVALADDSQALSGIFDSHELQDMEEKETTLESVKVSKLPTMAWALVGVPIEKFSVVQAMLDTMPKTAVVLTTVNNDEGKENGQSQSEGEA
mgnify:FL=1